jgi:hypothetical protein
MRHVPTFSVLCAFAREGSSPLACWNLLFTPSVISHQALKRRAKRVRALTVDYERLRSKRVQPNEC